MLSSMWSATRPPSRRGLAVAGQARRGGGYYLADLNVELIYERPKGL